MNLSPEILLGLMAVVIVGAGLMSIVGGLRRTAARRSYRSDGSDGGPMLGSGHGHKDGHNHHGHDHGGDGESGGGDGGGGDGGGD